MTRFPVIMGPTASGKSALALEIARRFNGEIVSADSMQLYRGLDRGTAKPTPAERAEIPHHLIDVLNLSERSDVFAYLDSAEAAVRKIRNRGFLPVVAGGTGLYLRAFLYGLDNVPADRNLRDKLDLQFDSPAGHEQLKKIMREKSPADFNLWKDHPRRLIRAYEVFLLSGKSMAELLKAWHSRPQRSDAVSFVLQWDRTELNKRIYQRCSAMLDSGWIEETAILEKNGLFSSPTAHQALGYPLIRDFLHGVFPRSELCERISVATRQFARRQETWFRGQHPDAVRIPMPCRMEDAVHAVISHCR